MASSASSGDGGFKFLMIAACRGGTGFICPLADLWVGLLVAPWVLRAPEGPAARVARRPHVVRRRASKPARALRSLRCPPHQWRLVDVMSRSPARPRRHPRAPQPGPPDPPAPFTPAGSRRHPIGRYLVCMYLARPRRHPRAPQPGPLGPPAPFTPPVSDVQARSAGSPRPRRRLLRPERSGLRPRDLALHSAMVSAKIIVSTPTWRVIRPPVR